MGIKAIVFDCGGVLLRRGDSTPYERWEQRLGMAPGQLAEYLWRGEPWQLAEHGQLSEDGFWERIGADLSVGDDQQVAALREEIWSTWEVDPQVLAVVDRARTRYRVAMLSNASDVLEEMLAGRYGVADRFETILNSARLGLAKPEKAVYEEMLRRLELAPGEVVFVDDRAENVTAAAALGIHVIWYLGPEELERQMRAYLRDGQPGDATAKTAAPDAGVGAEEPLLDNPGEQAADTAD
jgi:putative hydrolase of the HAD superfamily